MSHYFLFVSCAVAILFEGPLGTALEYDCSIGARQNAATRSPIEAMIGSVRVKRGDSVSMDQVLVALASGPERAKLTLEPPWAALTTRVSRWWTRPWMPRAAPSTFGCGFGILEDACSQA
jgi:hypothetical protein